MACISQKKRRCSYRQLDIHLTDFWHLTKSEVTRGGLFRQHRHPWPPNMPGSSLSIPPLRWAPEARRQCKIATRTGSSSDVGVVRQCAKLHMGTHVAQSARNQHIVRSNESLLAACRRWLLFAHGRHVPDESNLGSKGEIPHWPVAWRLRHGTHWPVYGTDIRYVECLSCRCEAQCNHQKKLTECTSASGMQLF